MAPIALLKLVLYSTKAQYIYQDHCSYRDRETAEVVGLSDVEVVAKEEPPKSPPPKHSDKVKKKLEEEEAEVDARVANQKMALHERLRNPIARANAQGDGAGLCRCMSMNKLLWLRGKETRKQSYCLV